MAGDVTRAAQSDEGVPPERVRQALAFLQRRDVWHVVSRNSPATGCSDAASRRRRLGREGIPLYDELRSFCGVFYPQHDRHAGRRIVLLHCRADSRFDLRAAGALLSAYRRIARLSHAELNRAGAAYGTVNPFTAPDGCIQVFDEGVLRPYTPPYTMMTNAGEDTWAIEFRPADVVEALRADGCDVRVGPIAAHSPDPVQLAAFGIITGNGPESGMTLWRHINQAVRSRLDAERRMGGDLSYPRVVLHSIPEMGLSMELASRERDVWGVIEQAIGDLRRSGVTHVAIACNTSQFFAEKVREACGPKLKFVSMVDATAEYLRREQVGEVTLIGIPVVADLGDLSGYRSLRKLGVRAVEPSAEPYLQELAYLVKRLDDRSPDNASLNRLQHVLRSGVPTGHVVIALTEISVLLERYPKLHAKIGGKTVIDPLRLCGEKMADIYLRSLPREDLEDESSDDVQLE